MAINRREFAQSAAAAGAMGTAPIESGRRGSEREQQSRLVVDGLDTSDISEKFLGLLRTGGVDCVHYSVEGLDSQGHVHGFLDTHARDMTLATTVRDIKQAKRQGRIALVLGVQHANLLEAMVEKTPMGTYDTVVAGLRAFYQLGLRIHGLCYNVANLFGGGCMDHGLPLTRAGRRLVEEIHKHELLLDVGGHTGERTSLDAIAMSSGVPIICSHTNVAALNPNPRAISDRLCEAIAGTGGVIGVTGISDFHVRNATTASQHGPRSPQASLAVHLDQYDYLKQLVGVDHIGLGPDFVVGWGDTFVHAAEESITFPPESLSDGHVQLVKDYEDISKLPNLIGGLRSRGWTEPELDKVLGANWLRVYERAWRA